MALSGAVAKFIKVNLLFRSYYLHSPSGGAKGTASDISIMAEYILKNKKKLNNIMAENTGRSIEEIERDTDRDHFMTAEEALNYGLIDQVITKRI